MRCRIYGGGVLIGDYDADTNYELAFKVAKAVVKSGRPVVFEEVGDDGSLSYIAPNYDRHTNKIEWPGRDLSIVANVGRPKALGQSIKIRLPDAAIEKAKALGMGDVAAGIIMALSRE